MGISQTATSFDYLKKKKVYLERKKEGGGREREREREQGYEQVMLRKILEYFGLYH